MIAHTILRCLTRTDQSVVTGTPNLESKESFQGDASFDCSYHQQSSHEDHVACRPRAKLPQIDHNLTSI